MSRHYVISDLHLGMGHRGDGTLHPLEDFTSDATFRQLLDLIERESGDELVINGDWLDFLQLEPLEAYPQDKLFSADGHRLGWTEKDSLKKFESCKSANAHRGFFDDLSSFLKSGRKLTVLMGNHDPDLFWDAVQSEVFQLLKPPERQQLEFVQTFIRRGTAHIEHGNQYSTPENKFYNPANVFHQCTQDQETRLEMVWGSIFMMEFFNKLEEEYPFADNVKTQLRATFLGIKNHWLGGRELAKMIKLLWRAGIPWGSLAETMEAQTPDRLIQNLDDQELAVELLALYDSDPKIRREFDDEITNHTSREEWRAIDSVDPLTSATQLEVRLSELAPQIDEVSPTANILREDPELRAARDFMLKPDIKQVIFGHTHMEIDGAHPNAPVANYFNTGSWVGSLDLSKKENRRRLESLAKEDLRDGSLYDLRVRYALIEMGENGETSVSLESLPTLERNNLVA